MPFQSTVFAQQGSGVPGEMATNSPWIAQPFTIDSTVGVDNVVGGVMCSITGEGVCAAGQPTDGLPFAGLLVDPKAIALFGTAGNPLAATMSVPNGAVVECATMGTFFVTLSGPANIGDRVIFSRLTGEISTLASSPFQVTGTTVNGNSTVTMALNDKVLPGQAVTGTGIPANTTVVSKVPGVSVTLSANATAAGTVSLTFTPVADDIPAGMAFGYATVQFRNVTAAGLAIIVMEPTLAVPTNIV